MRLPSLLAGVAVLIGSTTPGLRLGTASAEAPRLAIRLGSPANANPSSSPNGMVHPALERLDNAKLIAMAPLVKMGDMALIESRPDGTMKQVTLLAWVAAKPETVHDVIAKPGEYSKFIKNLSKSTWEKTPEGKWKSDWKMDLPVSEFDGINLYTFEDGPAGAIEFIAIDPNDEASFRYEMLPAAGGTLLVQYGYTDVKHSNNFVKKFLVKQRVMEHGLALAAQLMMVSAFRAEAERRTPAGSLPPVEKSAKAPGFQWLLDRGVVAIMRSQAGRLADISLIDRVWAPQQKLIEILSRPGDWDQFVPGLDEAIERGRKEGVIEFRSVMSVPLLSWDSVYQLRSIGNQIEGYASGGDLKGARFAWDLVPRDQGTMVIYRVAEPLAQSSIIVRKLFQTQPSLEHGISVAFGLVYLRAMRGRAEGWATK